MRKRVLAVLLIACLQTVSLQASPTLIAGAASKLLGGLKIFGEKAADAANFAKMTAILTQLKIVNEKQNDNIQDIFKEYKSVTSGEVYRDAIDSVYTYDVANTHSLWGQFSDIQSEYTGNNVVANVESSTANGYNNFTHWLVTPDSELNAQDSGATSSGTSASATSTDMSANNAGKLDYEALYNSTHQDTQKRGTLSEAGRQEQNNKQNSDLIVIGAAQNQNMSTLADKAKFDAQKEKEAEETEEQDRLHAQEFIKNNFTGKYMKERIKKFNSIF